MSSQSAIASSAPFESKLSEYAFHEKLGNGKFGEVYAGTHSSGQTVAVKVVQLAQVAKEEVRIMTMLKDLECVPKLFCFEVQGDRSYIVMSKGFASLDAMRKKNVLRTFEPPTMLKLIQQGVKALQAVHELNIVHRDVMLANFILSWPSGPNHDVLLQLIDFGLAAEIRDMNGSIKENRGNFRLSTHKFASPNVMYGGIPAPRDDLFMQSYAVMQMSGHDMVEFKQKDVRVFKFKMNLKENTAQFLPKACSYLRPYFEKVYSLPDLYDIDYNSILDSISACIRGMDLNSTLHLTCKDNEMFLL